LKSICFRVVKTSRFLLLVSRRPKRPVNRSTVTYLRRAVEPLLRRRRRRTKLLDARRGSWSCAAVQSAMAVTADCTAVHDQRPRRRQVASWQLALSFRIDYNYTVHEKTITLDNAR